MKFRYLLISVLSLALCVNGCSSSTTSDKNIDLTPPPVPTDLHFTEIGNGAVGLNWDNVLDTGLDGYYIYWLGETGIDILYANSRFVQTNFVTISGLDYDIEYFFGVTSVDKSGNESAISVQVSGKALNTTPPLPPSNVDIVAENIDNPQITIFWFPNTEPDLDHYNIYRALKSSDVEDSLSFFTSVKSDTTSIIDFDVEVGVKYYFRITAVDKGGWKSASSAVVSDYVLYPVELISPVDFESVSKTPTFKWEKIEGAISYHIYLLESQIGGDIWDTLVNGSTTQVTYSGNIQLISGEKYYWKVGAISRTEINSISSVGTFIVRNE